MRRWIGLALGALLLTAGCVGTSTSDDGPSAAEAPSSNASFEPATYTFEGEFLAGTGDQTQTHTFEVPEGGGEVMGLLTWSIPGGELDFQLENPEGDVVADGWGESDQHRYVTTTDPPTAGNWTAVVTANQGADIHYTLEVEAREAQPYGPIERTYTVQPQDFAEVNLNMAPGNNVTFDWQAEGEVYFNLHFHADNETQRPIEHTGTELSANFTAPDREVYSLLWSNEGATPVEVTVTMDGTYRLHSMTRDEPPG